MAAIDESCRQILGFGIVIAERPLYSRKRPVQCYDGEGPLTTQSGRRPGFARFAALVRLISEAQMLFCRILATMVVACSLTACSPTETDKEVDTAAAFHALLDEHWAAAQAEKIFFRTDPDAWRMDGKLSEHTAEARARRQQFNEHVIARLAEISIDDLDVKDRLSYRIFKYERETEREGYQQPDHFFQSTASSAITLFCGIAS